MKNPEEKAAVARAIQDYLAGDREAYDIIHQAYCKPLWYYLMSKANNRADAEDLFNMTCLKISTELKNLKAPDALIGWVLKIAFHCIYDYYQPPRKMETRPLDFELVGNESPETQAIASQRRRKLASCIQRLKEPEREYFVRHMINGSSQQEVCDSFNLKLNTLKSHIRRCKLALVTCLKRQHVTV